MRRFVRGMVGVAGWALLAAWGAAGAGEIALREEKVAEVTVFTTGSELVTRAGLADLPVGRTILSTASLPPQADASSVQVSLPGAAARIEAVETRQTLIDEKTLAGQAAAHREALQAESDKVFAAEQVLRAIDDEILTRTDTLEFLKQLRAQTSQTAGREMAVQELKVESWQAALAMAETRAQEARKVIRDLQGKRRDAEKTLTEAHRVYTELDAKTPQPTHETRVFITVSSEKAAPGTQATLRYAVNSAEWEPFYRANADLTRESLTLELFGTVRQNSGEDWTGVKLSLSTARLDLGSDLPELMPWYLRTAPMRDYAGKDKRREMSIARTPSSTPADSLEGDSETIAAGEVSVMPEPATERVTTGASTVFVAKAEATIPSDDRRHRIPVDSFASAIAVDHLAIPKVCLFAFRRATLEAKTPFPLLPGVVEVMVGDSFIGRGWMKPSAAGDALRLGLGIDESVKIEYRLREDKVERRRRGDRIATTNAFEITATNLSVREIRLTVLDQLPVSQSANVIVTPGTEAKRAATAGEIPGELRWSMALAAGKSGSIDFDFVVDYPEAMQEQLRAAKQQVDYNRNKISEVQDAANGNFFLMEQAAPAAPAEMKF